MSKVKIQGNASGTGVVTLTAPNTNTDRTITLPDGDISLGVGIDDNATSTAITIDASENVGIGTTAPSAKLHVSGGADSKIRNTATSGSSWFVGSNIDSYILHNESNTPMVFTTNGTERMRIDSAGRVTMPYQPAFLAVGNAGNTAYSAGSAFVLQSEPFDRGGNYNTTNGRFTAPISGVYTFQYGTYSYGNAKQFSIKVNGSDYAPTDGMGVFTLEANRLGGHSITLSLSSSDYVQFGFRNGHSGNVYMSHTFLSGFLVG